MKNMCTKKYIRRTFLRIIRVEEDVRKVAQCWAEHPSALARTFIPGGCDSSEPLDCSGNSHNVYSRPTHTRHERRKAEEIEYSFITGRSTQCLVSHSQWMVCYAEAHLCVTKICLREKKSTTRRPNAPRFDQDIANKSQQQLPLYLHGDSDFDGGARSRWGMVHLPPDRDSLFVVSSYSRTLGRFFVHSWIRCFGHFASSRAFTKQVASLDFRWGVKGEDSV